ncbi:ABC transporter ATP-binding protein [Tenggerimyces flavus]|uniref:ABC transporter ATP-binding protein n=1 Tax=Tenggerimyces flavus TaxID=1708749 RepID=A0ABV7Y309_9ACTN|nr:ABC transporter ATP-binding protein [Tenggerimyces flavus]MBM7790524.1 ABC-2 type transport system ATP-binding protein [Tenggerimyces flavus]
MEPVIEVRGLRKAYQDVKAVDGVDLTVQRGEIFALLGPNGAGKTTTVEILEGYRRRDEGEVRVLGEDPSTAGASWRAKTGVVLQEATDAGELSVKEMVEHFACYYPSPRNPQAVCELVGLTEKWGTRISKLSGGQRRRLDVALGILGHPELVFLDEPTTGFDPKARRQFWDLVRMLAKEGTTVLLTTHYLDEAEALADRAAVIVRGKVVAEGPPSELGGRQTGRAHVHWLEDGADHVVETDEPTRIVLELAHRLGGEVPELSIKRPTLEDIYLELVGTDAETKDQKTKEEVAA